MLVKAAHCWSLCGNIALTRYRFLIAEGPNAAKFGVLRLLLHGRLFQPPRHPDLPWQQALQKSSVYGVFIALLFSPHAGTCFICFRRSLKSACPPFTLQYVV